MAAIMQMTTKLDQNNPTRDQPTPPPTWQQQKHLQLQYICQPMHWAQHQQHKQLSAEHNMSIGLQHHPLVQQTAIWGHQNQQQWSTLAKNDQKLQQPDLWGHQLQRQWSMVAQTDSMGQQKNQPIQLHQYIGVQPQKNRLTVTKTASTDCQPYPPIQLHAYVPEQLQKLWSTVDIPDSLGQQQQLQTQLPHLQPSPMEQQFPQQQPTASTTPLFGHLQRPLNPQPQRPLNLQPVLREQPNVQQQSTAAATPTYGHMHKLQIAQTVPEYRQTQQHQSTASSLDSLGTKKQPLIEHT
ncbi:uncharacterized protein Dvir_GJ26189, partial [Drosophila virilis]